MPGGPNTPGEVQCGSTVADRAFRAVSLSEFSDAAVDEVAPYNLECPHDSQYILRMLVKQPHKKIQLPEELHWLTGLLTKTNDYQKTQIGVVHPFCYITVRHGPVISKGDDEWHVDGFSTRITHLPEQNYVVVSTGGFEYVDEEPRFTFPEDLDSLRHNVNNYLRNRIDVRSIKIAKTNTIYCIDPYILHRRVAAMDRTFVRISYTPIEIADDANTPNPLIPMRKYNRDGIAIRNQLSNYDD